MRPLKVALVALISLVLLCSSTYQDYPKIKVADGYVQIGIVYGYFNIS